MNTNCRTHRRTLPPPVPDPDGAIRALRIATDAGTVPGAVLACLDHERRPLTMFVLERCPPDPSALVVALEVLLDAIDTHDLGALLGELIVASSRPGAGCVPTTSDGEAWDQLDERCDRAGIGLLDWFILADGSWCSVPAHLGWASRW